MNTRNVDVLIDGCWGSTGKGNFISAIADHYTCFVRTGGPNAGHKVWIDNEDRAVTYRHIPSGARHNMDADLVLGPGSVINPKILLEEIESIGINRGNLYIDPQAVIISQEDIDLEKKLFAQIGSTTTGVGAATINKIMRNANGDRKILAKDCDALAEFICPALDIYLNHEDAGMRTLVEGTQGTMLSLHHGVWPYVTSRDTSASGQLGDAGIPPSRIDRVIMVVRTFPIRVKNPGTEDIGMEGGYSGPMDGKELSWADVAAKSGIPESTLTTNELTSCTKRLRRVSEFSDESFLKACQLNGPTDLAISFADYFADRTEFEAFARHLEEISRTTVSLVSFGFGAKFVEKRAGRW